MHNAKGNNWVIFFTACRTCTGFYLTSTTLYRFELEKLLYFICLLHYMYMIVQSICPSPTKWSMRDNKQQSKTLCLSTFIPSGSTLLFLGRSGPETRLSYKNLLKPTQRLTHVAICWVLSSAVCVPPCENGVCDRPGNCICEPGWTDSRCRTGKQYTVQ